MRGRSTLALAAAGTLVAATVAGCSAPTPTQLVVVVDTDLRIGSGFDTIEVEVRSPDGSSQRERSEVHSSSQLPMTLGVSPSGDALGPIVVTGRAFHRDELVVERTHRVTLVRGETRTLILHLTAICDVRVARPCPEGQTCSENGCVPEAIDGLELPPWTGRAPTLGEDAGAPLRRDAGADGGDAAPPDAGLDAGPPRCGGPADCDDGNPCTDDLCAVGGCENVPNAAGCDDGLFCNGADTCREGACTAHAGPPCAAPTSCDEATDRCTGCTAATECPTSIAGAWDVCAFASACAEAGLQSRMVQQAFTCDAGVCVPGTTAPETQACMRTTAGLVCAPPSCSGFGPCGDFLDACDGRGTQTETCTEGTCVDGTCSMRMVTNTIGCTRDTEGAACGDPTCTAWSDCAGFSDACDETGTQSRTCTTAPTCSAGVCGAGTSTPETQACTRNTDGVGCGAAGSCGAWSGCTSFSGPCDQSGTRTRSCSGGESCSGGVCRVGGDYTDSEGCSRSTEGNDCGGPTCTPWSPCVGFTDECDTTGTQTRTCTDPVCSGGACGGADVEETQACTRGTDGVACDDGDPCTYSETCSGGVCSGYSDCFAPCYCTATGICRDPGGGFCAI